MTSRLTRSLACTALFIVLIAFVAAGSAGAAPAPRIIGGAKVQPADFQSRYASVVSVQTPVTIRSGSRSQRLPAAETHVCTGTLIAPRLVLTAAHCIGGGTLGSMGGTAFEVVSGTRLLSGKAPAKGVDVQDVFVHPDWVGTPLVGYSWFGLWSSNAPHPSAEWDVAVLRLDRALDGVPVTPLVQSGEDAAVWGDGAGRTTGVSGVGWGETVPPGFPQRQRRGDRARELHAADLPIRADRRCERSDEGLGTDAIDFDAESMLCAGVADGPAAKVTARAACMGDSGGPLLAPAADGTQRIVGVASWTADHAPCRSWSVYTRAAAIREWVASIPEAGGGPDGLAAPTTVTASATSPNSLRVRWSEAAAGTATRYQLLRRADALSPPYYPFEIDALSVAGVTGALDRTLQLDGIEPRRPGQREFRELRVDAIDARGNIAPGRAVRVLAPVDRAAPTRPGAPQLRVPRRGGATVRFVASRDADCVDRYVLQVLVDRRWRGVSVSTNMQCDPLGGSPHGGTRNPGTRPNPILRLPVARLDAGLQRMRLVAYDRAGNRSVSASAVARVPKRIGNRYGYSCSGSSGHVYCTGTSSSGRQGFRIIIG